MQSRLPLVSVPFARLLFFFIIGIIVQWYYPVSISLITWSFVSCFILFASTFIFSTGVRYNVRWIQGILLLLIVGFTGMLLTAFNDIRTKKTWIGKMIATQLVVTISEQPAWKTNSIKSNAVLVAAKTNGNWTTATGTIICYFEKDSVLFKQLQPGSQFILDNSLQEIKSTQNPGAFNYQQYCAQHGIFHQAYLRKEKFLLLKQKEISVLSEWLYKTQSAVLNVLKTFVTEKNALSIAEALLIGYRIDLDRDLVQAYSNTGVVHIIAISGLHLAMIYSLLMKLVNIIPWLRKSRFKIIIVITALWAFSLLCGASASVLRAAVMFSFLLAGELMNKKQNSINTLAASAFCLLAYNPYFLWDVGFQLSYAAVFSIMLFYKPIYHGIYVKNKLLDAFWQLNAVTISAQVFTLPLIIFHFHQFPNTFLFSNLIAVPLSGIILYVEIILLIVAPLHPIAVFTGKILTEMIRWLNTVISYIDQFRYAVTDNIKWSILIVIFVYLLMITLYTFLNTAKPRWLLYGLTILLIIVCINGYEQYNVHKQQKLVIYNLPKHAAIDLIDGTKSFFIGDKTILNDPFLSNFHIKPSRILFQSLQTDYRFINNHSLLVGDKKLIISNHVAPFPVPDILIITGDPKLQNISFEKLNPHCIIVTDATNARWKTLEWKKQAERLHLRFHSVASDGAFVMDL